jgi:putative sigma-54 modulation protein
MTTNVKTTNFELTDSISDYLSKRIVSLDKFISKEERDSVLADIEIGKTRNGQNTGDIYRAEINLKFKGDVLRAESEKSDIYEAIDDMKNDITRQLRKHKSKRRTSIRNGAKRLKRMLQRYNPLRRSS